MIDPFLLINTRNKYFHIMDRFKKYWKEILIVLLTILFVSNCTSKGNYKRKYEKQIKHTEYVKDSLTHVFSNASNHIDSLNNEIKILNKEIASLNNEISIYKEQNNKLANKPVIVRVRE